MSEHPPTTKYTYTLVIHGNSHDEIEDELLSATRGGYLLDSGYYERDEFRVYGGRKTSTLVHANPEMTPERYKAELSAWSEGRKEQKRAKASEVEEFARRQTEREG